VTGPDPLLVFDRVLLRHRRERAARDWDRRAFLKREIAERLVERLDDVRRSFPLALDLGSHGDEIARALGQRKTVGWLVRADLGHGFARRAGGPAVVADVPHPGERIGRGHAICTVLADAADGGRCARALADAAAGIYGAVELRTRGAA